jgi:hypothetical protein
MVCHQFPVKEEQHHLVKKVVGQLVIIQEMIMRALLAQKLSQQKLELLNLQIGDQITEHTSSLNLKLPKVMQFDIYMHI